MSVADQVFVIVKQKLVLLAPEQFQPIFSAFLSILPVLIFFPALFAMVTLWERKGLGRIQNRLGPNRVGPYGLFQPIADGLKTLTKEDIVPIGADQLVHFLAPLTLLVPTFLAYAVIPFGRNMVPLQLDAGILFFFAAGAAGELAVFMAGWSSRNKYSLLGAMRAMAQMISYEVPLVLSAVAVIMAAGTLSLSGIVDAQAGYHLGFIGRWFVFTPWGFAAFVLFLIATLAEANRTPFDIPEAESELVAGYLTEYSGFKFALFFLAEYLGLFALSALAITLFLGGWHAPFSFLAWVPSYLWFVAKLAALIAVFIWVRGTLPRLRFDQLLNFAWKFMLPMALITILVAAVWVWTRQWDFPASRAVRWGLGCVLIALPYYVLGKKLYRARGFGPRTYRFA